MTTLDNFTIDLVSNGSMEIFPNNTLSKFENQIDPALELDGDWEVALTEIYFPIKFAFELPEKIKLSFHIEAFTVTILKNIPVKFTSKNWGKVTSEVIVEISPEDAIDKILQKINLEMEKSFPHRDAIKRFPKFSCENGKTKFTTGIQLIQTNNGSKQTLKAKPELVASLKVKFKKDFNVDIEDIFNFHDAPIDTQKLKKYYYDNKFIGEFENYFGDAERQFLEKFAMNYFNFLVPRFQDSSILKYLGFDTSVEDFMNIFSENKQEHEVTTPLYHKNNVNLMYIYTDIIRDHTVGGPKAPVLRTVPLSTGIYQGIGYCTFEHRIYYPIRKNHIESIAILCLDDTGEQIKFANVGRVFVSLDLRKRS